MEVLIIQSKNGWPIIEKGEIYKVVRITREDYVCESYPMGNKFIPKSYCKIIQSDKSFQKSIFDEIPDVKIERKIQDTNFKHYKKFKS